MLSKSMLIAAAGSFALVTFAAGTANARQSTKPVVTGVGYSYSKAGATGRAIRAWTNEVEDRFGARFANYNVARKTRLDCEYIGGTSNRRKRSYIGVDGDPNARWTCTTTARPVSNLARRGDRDDDVDRDALTHGVGFANSQFVARRLAVQAWSQAARADYGRGFGRFWTAGERSLECARVRDRYETYGRRQSIRTIGNPASRFSCTASGRPRNSSAGLRWMLY